MPRPRTTSLVMLSIAAIAVAGCFPGGTPGVAVSGRVTYRGKPVDDAMIFFQHDAHKSGRLASAYIEGGRYSIPAERGPMPGEFNVEIVSTGTPTPPAKEGIVAVEPARIPAKYNTETELRVVIPARKSYELSFDLK